MRGNKKGVESIYLPVIEIGEEIYGQGAPFVVNQSEKFFGDLPVLYIYYVG